jgi:hypothetical protein
MAAQTLTDWERQTLEHLQRAQERGATLRDYAAQSGLNVQELYSGKGRLRRKGFWPTTKSATAAQPELLAVRVMPDINANDALVCRLTGPNGWVIECCRWPEAKWLAGLMVAAERASP